MVPDWLRCEVVAGLQHLLVLRLPGSPAADTAVVTAETWLATIGTVAVAWSEPLDRLRVRKAFRHLSASCERWPAPKHFFDALPARNPAQPKLGIKLTAEERAENKRRIGNIIKTLAQAKKVKH